MQQRENLLETIPEKTELEQVERQQGLEVHQRASIHPAEVETIPEKTEIWGQVNNRLEKIETRNELAITSVAMEGQTKLIETHLKAETFTYYPPIFV